MASGFSTIENRFAEILANLPNRFVAVVLKFLVQPFGARVLGPSDLVIHQCAQLVLEPSAARDRLTPDLSHVDDDRGVARLEKAFLLVTGAEDIARRMRAAHIPARGVRPANVSVGRRLFTMAWTSRSTTGQCRDAGA